MVNFLLETRSFHSLETQWMRGIWRGLPDVNLDSTENLATD